MNLNKKVLLIITIVIALSVLGITLVVRNQGQNNIRPITNDDVRKVVLSKSVNQFPSALLFKNSDVNSLPVSFEQLVVPTAQNVLVQKISYEKGKTGYYINFTDNADINTSFSKLYSILLNSVSDSFSGRWKISVGTYSRNFGIIEATNNQSMIDIYASQISQNLTMIKIQTVSK